MFSWYKYLIVSLVFSHLGFWSGSLFLIAHFPDLCLLVLFDTPPHKLLKSKLFSYGIGGKTIKWIDVFLCYRQQRVVVNGVKSD